MTSRSISPRRTRYSPAETTLSSGNTAAYASSTPRTVAVAWRPACSSRALCSRTNENASTPGIRATAAVSIASAGNVCPSRAETVRSAAKAEYIDFTRLSKPLKTESRMIIAATGIATATTLSPEIRLTSGSGSYSGLSCLSASSICSMYSSESSRKNCNSGTFLTWLRIRCPRARRINQF